MLYETIDEICRLCAIMFPSAVIARGETVLGPQTVWIETEAFDEKGG